MMMMKMATQRRSSLFLGLLLFLLQLWNISCTETKEDESSLSSLNQNTAASIPDTRHLHTIRKRYFPSRWKKAAASFSSSASKMSQKMSASSKMFKKRPKGSVKMANKKSRKGKGHFYYMKGKMRRYYKGKGKGMVDGASPPPTPAATSSPTFVRLGLPPTPVPTPQPSSSPPSPPFVGEGVWQLRGNRIDTFPVGYALRMSSDGNTIAVTGKDSLVRVLQWEESTGQWNLVGSPLPGPQLDFPISIAMSNDASRIAFVGGDDFETGPVRVYQLVSDDWEAIGNFRHVMSGAACQLTGISMDMTGDGRRIAVAAPRGCGIEESGVVVVQVFDWQDDSISWMPATLPTGLPNLRPPSAPPPRLVALASDGLTLGVTFPDDMTGNAERSFTSVYILDTNSWSETNVVSTQLEEFYARGVAFSADGGRVVVADKRFEDGVTRVQTSDELEDLTWDTLRPNLVDANNCCVWYTYENSVALSDDGNVLIFGNAGYGVDGNSAFQGSTHIYEWTGDSWHIIGALFGTPAASPQPSSEIWFGYSTDISADGKSIAIAAPSAAYVEVYDYVR